jgi:tRNA modification GTPase
MAVTSERHTIFALSSGRPPAAIAVVRVSGTQAATALTRMIGRVPAPRHATLARVRDPDSGSTIDQALALWLPGPGTETGEDTVELQVHGGRAVIAAVLAALGRLPGFRPAEAGEFTRRAFENGRMDLTAVEGLADLIGAETEAQRRQALQQLEGLLGEKAESWRQRLINALAVAEAGIDFPDEGDVPQTTAASALEIARPLADEIAETLRGHGERLREGLRVAIAGPPNAGKSTLFNCLARREAAIVSIYPGTTRDVLEAHLDIGGYPVTVLDTAGIRDSIDPIEQEGVRRATAQAASADLVLWVVDAVDAGGGRAGLPEAVPAGARAWLVVNKIDLLASGPPPDGEATFGSASALPVYLLSCRSGAGLAALIAALQAFAAEALTTEPALVTRERQRAHLRAALEALTEALALGPGEDDLVCEQLRLATRSLERLLGRVDVESVLDVIFRDFCIGK